MATETTEEHGICIKENKTTHNREASRIQSVGTSESYNSCFNERDKLHQNSLFFTC
jgi:hypothetical protein